MTENIVASLDYTSRVTQKQTLSFTWPRFEELGDVQIISQAIPCHGYNWMISFYPHGDGDAQDTGHFSAFLYCQEAREGVLVQDCVHTLFSIRTTSVKKFHNIRFSSDCHNWGNYKFCLREHLLQNDLTEDGKLTIKVDLQIIRDQSPVWKPQKQIQSKLARLAESGTGDIEFLVRGTTVRAHQFLVSIHCPTLLEFDGVVDADANLFKQLMVFMYKEEISDEFDWKRNGVGLLELADRFGYTDLKLYAEAMMVDKCLEISNVAELLLLAEGHSCALLKEAALDLFTSDPAKSMTTDGWTQLQESGALVSELLRHPHQRSTAGYETVGELRYQLDSMGENVDGSKEMLVERLRSLPRNNNGNDS